MARERKLYTKFLQIFLKKYKIETINDFIKSFYEWFSDTYTRFNDVVVLSFPFINYDLTVI